MLLRLYISMPLLFYASIPLCLYSSTPLLLYTSVLRLHISASLRLYISVYISTHLCLTPYKTCKETHKETSGDTGYINTVELYSIKSRKGILKPSLSLPL